MSKFGYINKFFSFFNSNFFGSILSLKHISIFEIRVKFLIFLYPIWPTVFQGEKKFTIEGPFFNFLDIQPQIWKKPLKIQKNTFYKIVLEISSQSKNTWGIANFKNHCTLLYIYCIVIIQNTSGKIIYT